jgi:hypothetical protein
MNNRKMNLDRPNLNSEQIASKQNFQDVLTKFNATKAPVWKSPWFWGPTSLASLAAITLIGMNSFSNPIETHDKNNTLAQHTQLPNDTECIKPPVISEDIPFSVHQVDPKKDQTIRLLDGTKISIPAGSLVPIDLAKKVQIKVRKFNDKASVFVAGIPMDYGDKTAFESAGMIEIKGVQNGESVELNADKPIEIELQLTQNPATFDFWYLDEEQKAWGNYPATFKSDKISGELQVKDNSKKLESKFETVSKQLTAVDQEIGRLEKPTQTDFKIPVKGHQKFDLAFNKGDYPELSKFQDLVFEIIPTTGYDKNFASLVWSEALLEKRVGGGYEMILRASKREIKLPVRPVLGGKELKEAEKEFDAAIENFQLTNSRLKAEKEKLESEKAKLNLQLLEELKNIRNQNNAALIQRNVVDSKNASSQSKARGEVADFQNVAKFQVTRWGLYNCDKSISYPEPLEEQPFIAWKGGLEMKAQSIYVFDLDKNTRYSFGAGNRFSLEQLGWFKKNDIVIVAIDEAGKIGALEISKSENSGKAEKILFEPKETGEKTVDWLKKMMHESVDIS